MNMSYDWKLLARASFGLLGSVMTYIVLSGIHVQSDGVGVLRGQRRVGNVVPDLHLGDDGT
jgi:hypothetical protein